MCTSLRVHHEDLVAIAARWLRVRGHDVVLSDVRSRATSEQPDVIGWRSSGTSTLIECKASRQDFALDRRKWCRRSPAAGMGQFRYYCVPAGLLHKAALPRSWGLLEVEDETRLVMRTRATKIGVRNERGERALLVGAMRRGPARWSRETGTEDVAKRIFKAMQRRIELLELALANLCRRPTRCGPPGRPTLRRVERRGNIIRIQLTAARP